MNTLFIYTRWILSRHARTALIWALSFAGYVAAILAIFPSMGSTDIASVVDEYPDALQSVFNMGDMSTASGWLNMEVYSYAPLVIAFFPIMALAGAIAGLEEQGGMDIYLAQPLSRRDIVLANVIAVALWTLAILTITGLVSWGVSAAGDMGLSLRMAMAAALDVFPIAFEFGMVALVLSSVVRSKGAAVGGAFGVMFLMYLLDIVGKISADKETLRLVSPFRFYGHAIDDGVNWNGWLTVLVVGLVLVGMTIWLFRRRDVYT